LLCRGLPTRLLTNALMDLVGLCSTKERRFLGRERICGPGWRSTSNDSRKSLANGPALIQFDDLFQCVVFV